MAYKVLVLATEYRTYIVNADDAASVRITFEADYEGLDYERGDDGEEPPEIIDYWETP